MIGRIMWIAALLALGLITALAQVDRSSRFDPVLAHAVPAPFRGFAQASLAGQAVAAGNGAAAADLARDLVRVRPMPAENLALLAQANLLAGNAETGLAALEEAGKRGWREPFSQRAMAQAALLTGNADAASLRIAALLATGTLDRASIDELVTGLVATPEGRDALARRLAEDGYWQKNFVRRGPVVMEPAQFADVIARAQALGAAIDCSSLASATTLMRNRGHESLVQEIWPGDCPAR